MKKKIKSIIIIIAIITHIFATQVFADVGSFDRYDSGSSFSSSSSSWGSSSSSSHDWGRNSRSSSSDGSFDFLIGFLLGNNFGRGILVLFIIMFIISAIKNRKSSQMIYPLHNNPNSEQNLNNSDLTRIHVNKIMEIDPNFSEEKMLSWAKDLYVKLQNAWTAREWEPMRPFETQALFEQHNAQVQNYINTNRINVVDRIAVNYARIYDFRQEGDRDILEIALKATKKDYIIDATTKQLLEGNKTQDRITVYKMTFERKTGVLTPEGTENVQTTNCPNCGAPTKITSAGKCEYCGSVITTGANTWVLSGLEPL